jgi:hypothetical protein
LIRVYGKNPSKSSLLMNEKDNFMKSTGIVLLFVGYPPCGIDCLECGPLNEGAGLRPGNNQEEGHNDR